MNLSGNGSASIAGLLHPGNVVLYSPFSRDLAKSMTEEARRFVGDLVWNDRSFMDVFTAKYSFINLIWQLRFIRLLRRHG